MASRSPARLVLAGLSALALLAPVAVEAQEASPVGEYRASTMQAIRHHNGALRAILEGNVALDGHAVRHARALRGLAIMAADVFPEGSGDGTRALPAIWADHGAFQERLLAFQAATAELLEAAEAGDAAAMQEAAGAVGRSCRDCHGDFRADPS